jgi:Pentapeptide repeats (8 copies)
MANDEHVALLKQGVAAWNAWRDENPGTRPDLSEANLSGTNLRGANLREAGLSKAEGCRDNEEVERLHSLSCVERKPIPGVFARLLGYLIGIDIGLQHSLPTSFIK